MISHHIDPTESRSTGRYCTLTIGTLSLIFRQNLFSHIIDEGFVINGDNIGYILHKAVDGYY